jgi:hypothetical protein
VGDLEAASFFKLGVDRFLVDAEVEIDQPVSGPERSRPRQYVSPFPPSGSERVACRDSPMKKGRLADEEAHLHN